MKFEWRKHEKDLYGVKQSPRIVNIPQQQFIMLEGKGNPNSENFSHKVSALFSLAYAIKMQYKNPAVLSNDKYHIHDYTVYPLEAIWKDIGDLTLLDKKQLEYTIMIRQPHFITDDMFKATLERIKIKKPNEFYKEIYFDTMDVHRNSSYRPI